MKFSRFIAAVTACIYTAFQPAAAQTATADSEQSLLWKIEHKGQKSSYLFGTIHVICEQDYLWTKAMEKSLHSSEKVCMEMDMDDPGLMMKVAAGLIDTSGKLLKEYFTEKEYSKLKAYMNDSLNLDVDMLQTMKPSILMTLLAKNMIDCRKTVSYEEKIMKVAQSDKKEITGLELPEEQIALINSIPADTMVKYVMDIVNNADTSKSEYMELIAAYKKQDLIKLEKAITESGDPISSNPEFLEERNIRWISNMDKKMKENATFFAVGAGHLVGKKGLINLLRKEGYTVTPLH